MPQGKTFHVEGFGTVGEANLMGFVPTSGPMLHELEIGQSSDGEIDKVSWTGIAKGGITVKLDKAPAWHVKQHKNDPKHQGIALVFGNEISLR